MSNVFGPKKPLFGPYTYRTKQNSNGDTLIAVYHGSKRVAHIDAYWAYSMRAIEEHEAEEAQRVSGSGGTRRRLVCASDLRALGAEGRYPNVLRVGHAFVDDEAYKGKGIGRAMYEAMMAEGFVVRETRVGGQPGPMFLIPDECGGAGNTSADAKRVWASLARGYPSQGTSIRVDAPPVIGSRAKVNPRRRNPETVLTEKRNGVLVEREGGYLYAARKGSTLHVVTVELPESVRGMGHGISMYERLFDYAKKNGFTVVSYPTVELPAARVWEAMARRGYPVVRHPSAILVSSRDGDIDFWYVKGGNEQTPVFSVARTPRETNPRRNPVALSPGPFGGTDLRTASGDGHANVFVGTGKQTAQLLKAAYPKYPDVIERAGKHKGKVAWLDYMEARETGKGAGSRVLAETLTALDAQEVEAVYLHAASGEEQDARVRFFGRHGFVPLPDDADRPRRLMVRLAPKANPRRRNSANTREEDESVPDCAWCGAACDQPHPYPNRRGEVFCSPSHRSASNRALARFLGAHADSTPHRRRNPRAANFYSRPATFSSSGNEGGTRNPVPQVAVDAFIGTPHVDNVVGYLLASHILPEHVECREEYARLHTRFGDAPIYAVTNVNLDKELRKKGLGRELYVLAGKAAAGKTGAYLLSDACWGGTTTPAAMRVWASLARDYAVEGEVAYFPPPSAPRTKPRRRNPRDPKTETLAFKEWFRNSKIVDAEGNPLVVYHGGFDVLNSRNGTFRKSKAGTLGSGIYFTPNRSIAENYVGYRGGYEAVEGGVLTEVYLSIQNPLVIRTSDDDQGGGMDPAAEALILLGEKPERAYEKTERIRERLGGIGATLPNAARAAGYDGIIRYDSRGGHRHEVYEIVAFEPWQVKSATRNAGTYYPYGSDIRTNPRQNPDRWRRGKCLVFAEALKRVAGRKGTLYDVVEVTRLQTLPHHVVLRIGDTYWDSEGPSTEAELLARWEARAPAGVHLPLRLEKHDPKRARDFRYPNMKTCSVDDRAAALLHAERMLSGR